MRSGQRVALLLLLVVAGAVPSGRGRADQDHGEFVHETVQRWCQGRERHDDLQVSGIDVRFRAELDRLGVRFEASKYPGLLRLLVEEPEHELIGRLAAERIVPARIEPRVNLVSVYLELTRGATE